MKIIGGDLLKQVKAEFEARCPDIPCAKARVAAVFGPTNLEQAGVNLQTIADLAYDIGLEPCFAFAERKA